MKWIKEIGARIWAFWALVVFVSTLFIVVWPILISYRIKEPRGVSVFQWWSKLWMNVFLHAVGCPITVKGKEHYAEGQQYVVVANHQSLMDVPLLTPFFPGPNKTIAKKSLANIPFFGWVYARGAVLVDRGDDNSRKRSFDLMKAVLQRDHLCMAIYPEGTRNRTGTPLKTFYDGAFKLAATCKKDIIPVVMMGTAEALPPGKFFYLWPTPLTLQLLPPVLVEGKTSAAIKEEVHKNMWQFIEQINSDKPRS